MIGNGRKKIVSTDLKFILASAVLKKDTNSWLSYNAGTYVCNFSMYIISDLLQNSGVKYAFLHIPKQFDVDTAVHFVEAKIKEMVNYPNS